MPLTLVVLSARLGPVLPAAALPALRVADRVVAEPGVPEQLITELDAERPAPGWFTLGPLTPSLVVLTTDPAHPLRRRADTVTETPEPPGAALLDAVAVMDRLRSSGGCPWDAEQTHTSLLRYLVEECYELYQAVEDADRAALREELGDVLLQVLFHARLAAEGAVAPYSSATGAGSADPGSAGSAGSAGADVEPFDIDEVAADLVAKLVGRHPHVFHRDPARSDRVRTAREQERRWDELKRVEKSRESVLDGVALGQPAVALVAKLVSRARKAGVPEHLLRRSDLLFDQVVAVQLAGADPEHELRALARELATELSAAEHAARRAGLDPHRLGAADWRRFWPAEHRPNR